MFGRHGRPFFLVAGVFVLAVAVAVAYLFLPPRPARSVAVPAPDASPEQIVAVYIDALNAHDCDTAKAVMIESARDSPQSWCDDVASLTNVDVSDHFKERPEHSGHSAWEEVVNVPVTFDLSWRPFHNDGSMHEGPTTWGYLLVRGSTDSPWRIFDQGVG